MTQDTKSSEKIKRTIEVRTLILSLLLCIFPVLSASAQEDSQWAKMLEGYKERRYFDTAIEYLDWMKTSPICPSALKKQIDFQIAMVHIDAVELDGLFLPREEHMKKCRESLEKFLKENPQSDQAFEAQSTLGRLYMEEGRITMLKADHETTKDPERGPLREKARGDFRKAIPYFEAADKLATERAKKLQEMQKANPASVKEDALFAAYGQFLAGKIMINLVKTDVAKTYPKDSKEFKEGVTAVAKDFEALSKKYSGYSAGFDAKLYAAKAYKELGDFKKTRELLGELNTLQGDDFLKIRTESLLLALEMNLIEKKPENYLDSINRAKGWNDSVPASAKADRDGQWIYLIGAKNFIAYAETVKNNKADYDRAIRDAGAFLRQIKPTYPQIAKEATELLRSIGAVKVNKGDPENYEQAKEFADDDWKDFAMAYSEYNDAKGPDKDKAKARLNEIGAACLASFNRAVNMREEGTPMAEINTIRLNLVRVYWFQGKLLEAALLSDYLTQRYSGAPDADKTAVMAVRLYRQIFVEDKLAGHDPSAIADRLDKLCSFILARWEGQPEVTGEVQLLQIETAIDNGNIAEAKKLLAQTAEGTPQRVSAELKIGQSLWNRYATLSRLPEGADDKPEKKELDALLADAKKQLEMGLTGKLPLIKDGKVKVDGTTIQCALALGQICVNANNNADAIKWLTDPLVGPLALVANPPAGMSEDLLKLLKSVQLNATMFVLRAYVGNENLDKAEETMNQLETVIKEQEADEQKLTQIYVSLGRQLENRLKELNEAGEVDQAEKVAKGFELFLTRIKNRGEANSFQSLYWVADTFYRLGSGMSTEKTVPEQAKEYYKLAGGTYVDILKRVASESGWAPERAENTIKVRLAESLRCIGQYEAAMKFLSVLLDETESRLDIQIEAALTLEAWGKTDHSKLSRAVAGGYPSRKVWGWNGLIKRTSTNIEQFAEFYYEAYLNKFRCVLEVAKGEKDKEKREKLLNNAERDLTSLILMRPQLGGQEFFARFDQTYKNIEKAKGVAKPGGLKELLKTLGEKEPAVENVAAVEDTVADDAAMDDAKQEKKKASGKSADSKAVAAQEESYMPMWIGLGLVILATPICLFFATRKKKR